MKIAILSFYSGSVARGMETVVAELSKRWSNSHQVKVFSGKATGTILSFTLGIWLPLKTFGPDIIIPANGGWQPFLMKAFSFLYKKKLVIIGEAGLGRDDKWNLLLKPDLFVALTERNERWARKHAWQGQKIAVVPNGVDLIKFKPQSSNVKTKSQISNLKKPITLCVAGPERYKRVRETMIAVKKMGKGSLLLAGGSKGTKKLGEKLLRKRFLQIKVKHENMPNVYHQTDVFTLVSESCEAFGVAYLEAMACGLPVVATDDELRREIIGQAGLFVKNPEDVNEYAKMLIVALSRNWHRLPRKRAEKFSWDKIAGRYLEEFGRLHEKTY